MAEFSIFGRSGAYGFYVSLMLMISLRAAFAATLHKRQDLPGINCGIHKCLTGGHLVYCKKPKDIPQLEVCLQQNCTIKGQADDFWNEQCQFVDADTSTETSLVVDTSAIPSKASAQTTLLSTTSSSLSSISSPTATVEANNENSDDENGDSKQTGKKGELSTPIIVGIAVGGTVFLLLSAGIWYLIACLRKRKRKAKEQNANGKGFDSDSMSDIDSGSTRGIPLGKATKKEKWGSGTWIDQENNSSTAYLHKPAPTAGKARLPPIKTGYVESKPLPPRSDASSGDVSPVSPVSPLSECNGFDDRRSKALSAVSSLKAEDRTHLDYYNVASPPLPTPAPGINAHNHLSTRSKPAFLDREPNSTNQSDYPQEPVSPLSSKTNAKSVEGRSDVSAMEYRGLEEYWTLLRKYEEQIHGAPALQETVQRNSGLSQFNFGFGINGNSPIDTEKKKESSYYGWAPERNNGYLEVASGRDREKYLSGSSSIYSRPPVSPPPPPVGCELGPITPDMFSDRPTSSDIPPSPQPVCTAGRSLTKEARKGSRSSFEKGSPI
ncbi:hypothetical protein BDZ91DRAFT_122004 [Kalaharituber pfeilii]|nr:hypothetical protein BDZ91DRAFT_122004 [Kalaharituber pfeilii]